MCILSLIVLKVCVGKNLPFLIQFLVYWHSLAPLDCSHIIKLFTWTIPFLLCIFRSDNCHWIQG